MRAITLSLPTLGARNFYLRALDGHGELQVDKRDPQSANRLLGALLRERDGSAVDLSGLLATWRDRALAEIYRATIGENLQCRSRCGECKEEFEFELGLAAILAEQDSAAASTELELGDDGQWTLASGSTLRPPTLADIAGSSDPDALARTLAGDADVPREQVEETLESAAPLLGFELDTACPECDAQHQIAFEIGRFLVDTIAAERAFLIRETHLIASRYGWDHASIMGLPRNDRQAYAGLIENERSAALTRRA